MVAVSNILNYNKESIQGFIIKIENKPAILINNSNLLNLYF